MPPNFVARLRFYNLGLNCYSTQKVYAKVRLRKYVLFNGNICVFSHASQDFNVGWLRDSGLQTAFGTKAAFCWWAVSSRSLNPFYVYILGARWLQEWDLLPVCAVFIYLETLSKFPHYFVKESRAHEGEGEPQSCLCQLKFAADFILCHTSALGCAPLSISAGERFGTKSLRNFLLCLSLSPIFMPRADDAQKLIMGQAKKRAIGKGVCSSELYPFVRWFW